MKRTIDNGLKESKQLGFDLKNVDSLFIDKLFDLRDITKKKFRKLSEFSSLMFHSEIVWASRIEEFFLKHEYLTEKQHTILDTMIKKYAVLTGEMQEYH